METPGYTTPQPPEQKSNKGLIIGVIVVIVLCCCCVVIAGGIWGIPWLWENGDQLLGTGALLSKLVAL